MYERFSDRARKAMHLASQEAKRLNHEYVGTEHILLGLAADESPGLVTSLFWVNGIGLQKLRVEVEKIVQPGLDMVTFGDLPAKRIIAFAIEESAALGCVNAEHLLLGLLRETEGVACQVLMNLGVTLESVRQAIAKLATAKVGDVVAEGEVEGS